MILQELFDTKGNIDWDEEQSGGRMVGEFSVGQTTGTISANYMSKAKLGRNIEYYTDKPIDPQLAAQLGDDGVEIEFYIGNQQTITGLGGKDVYAIFAIVKNSINDIISRLNPDFLFFTAEEPSRRKLYDRMVKGTNHFTYVNRSDVGKGYVIVL